MECEFDAGTGVIIRVLEGHGWATNFAIDSSGQLLATAGNDRAVRLWDLRDYWLIRTLEGHTDAVVSLSFLPNSTILASKGRGTDSTVRLWNCETGTCLAAFDETSGTYWLPPAIFDPHGRYLATVGSRPDLPKISQSVRSRLDDPYAPLIHLWELDPVALTQEWANLA